MQYKILYLMHIDWNWIIQRPQYLAIYLSYSKKVKVKVLYRRAWNRNNLVKNNIKNLDIKPLYCLTGLLSNNRLQKLNSLWAQKRIQKYIDEIKPDYIWVTHPLLLSWIRNWDKYKLIYDCMDDILEFTLSKTQVHEIARLEKSLVENATCVFVSSEHLFNVINDRYAGKNTITLIRNAYDGDLINEGLNNNCDKSILKAGYIGTISDWIDFDMLIKSLNAIPNLEYHLIGPIDKNLNVPKHPRLKMVGPVDHDRLFSYVTNYDCLMIPFVVNKLIMSVDPVKLYEYINFNKPIISIYYPEIERFKEFVDFYSNSDEFLEKMIEASKYGFELKYNLDQRREFLIENTWQSRVNEVIKAISGESK